MLKPPRRDRRGNRRRRAESVGRLCVAPDGTRHHGASNPPISMNGEAIPESRIEGGGAGGLPGRR